MTLLCIHSYKAARNTVWRNWSQYKIPGWDIIGIDAVNGQHDWPEGTRSVQIGRDEPFAYHSRNLCDKLIGTFKLLLHDPACAKYNDICIIEHDGFFLYPPPPHPGGLFTCRSGTIPGSNGVPYFHTPWWADRLTAEIIVKAGEEMLAEGKIGLGTPDFFLGEIATRAGIKWTNTGTFSVNSGDFRNRLPAAEESIKRGTWYIHGPKEESEFQMVLKLNKDRQ